MQQENMPVRFQDLITKFYYKQNHLCFQIILNVGNDEMVPYQEFTDYQEYKVAFEKLSKMKQSIPVTPAVTTSTQTNSTIYA